MVKKPKFNNRKVELDGLAFDSKKEARRYNDLKLLCRAGEISDLKTQVYFELAPKVKLWGETRTKSAIRYVADFTYIKDGQLIIEDVKSAITKDQAVFRMKKHLMKTVLGLDVQEY